MTTPPTLAEAMEPFLATPPLWPTANTDSGCTITMGQVRALVVAYGALTSPSAFAESDVAVIGASVPTREDVARLIDPKAFTEAERMLGLTFNNRPAPAPGRALDLLSPVMAKADAILALFPAQSGVARPAIPTWRDRCEMHPDHASGIVSNQMIEARMQEEIDELRAALSTLGPSLQNMQTTQEGRRPIESAPRNGSEFIALTSNRAGCEGALIIHWADGGGEDQPPFKGWFFWTGYDFREITTGDLLGWPPLPPKGSHG